MAIAEELAGVVVVAVTVVAAMAGKGLGSRVAKAAATAEVAAVAE